tara:strand:+ start:100 stop:336 length:237 start_codon:yes stop_codon:yes gene_type:complete
MNNEKKYIEAFKEAFMVNEEQLTNLKYQDIDAWDSVGHMSLMALIEESFEIEMDIDDIIDFSSFKEGKRILSKYEISI